MKRQKLPADGNSCKTMERKLFKMFSIRLKKDARRLGMTDSSETSGRWKSLQKQWKMLRISIENER